MDAPAGWYPDPELVHTRRYWDGVHWTEHRQEHPPTLAVERYDAQAAMPSTHSWGTFWAVLCPLIGLFYGIVVWRRDTREGRRIVLLSVAAWAVYTAVWYVSR